MTLRREATHLYQLGESDHSIQRGTKLVAHKGEKIGFRLTRGLRYSLLLPRLRYPTPFGQVE